MKTTKNILFNIAASIPGLSIGGMTIIRITPFGV